MQLTEKQLKIFRQPFEEIGALNGRSEEDIKKLLEEVVDFYVAFANINLRLKQKSDTKENENNV